MTLAIKFLKPSDLDGVAALMAAQSTPMWKLKDERDTEFVKRIACAYMNAHQGFDPADDKEK